MNKKQERIRQEAEKYARGEYVYPTEDIYPPDASDWEKGYWAAIDQEEWKNLYAEGIEMGRKLERSIQTGKPIEP